MTFDKWWATLETREQHRADKALTEEAFTTGAASRDVEIAELQKAIDENWVTHQQIVAASKERDQLRDEIAELVAALTLATTYHETHCDCAGCKALAKVKKS